MDIQVLAMGQATLEMQTTMKTGPIWVHTCICNSYDAPVNAHMGGLCPKTSLSTGGSKEFIPFSN